MDVWIEPLETAESPLHRFARKRLPGLPIGNHEANGLAEIIGIVLHMRIPGVQVQERCAALPRSVHSNIRSHDTPHCVYKRAAYRRAPDDAIRR